MGRHILAHQRLRSHNPMTNDNTNLTLGEICAGIGGFSAGFEQAGWSTKWQIELDDVNRAVLADRSPRTAQFKNLFHWRSFNLSPVACIAFGSPCQNISNMGASRRDKSNSGLNGNRSGLFFECLEIVSHFQPTWVVFENVAALLHSNDCRDLQTVIAEFAQRGYVGFWRVLDAQYFGIPQKRRRLLLVAGFGKSPSMDFLADAAPVESLSCAAGSEWIAKPADAWAGYTLTAPDKNRQASTRINLGSELLIIEEDGWHQMVDRAREVELHGLSSGLDATNLAEAYAAGNAIPPPIANWIAEILKRS